MVELQEISKRVDQIGQQSKAYLPVKQFRATPQIPSSHTLNHVDALLLL